MGRGRGLAWGSGAWSVALWCHLGGWCGVGYGLVILSFGLWPWPWWACGVCGVWCVWVLGGVWGLGLVRFGLGLSVVGLVLFVAGVWCGGWGWMGSMGDGHVGLCGVSDVVWVGGGGWGLWIWCLGVGMVWWCGCVCGCWWWVGAGDWGDGCVCVCVAVV